MSEGDIYTFDSYIDFHSLQFPSLDDVMVEMLENALRKESEQAKIKAIEEIIF